MVAGLTGLILQCKCGVQELIRTCNNPPPRYGGQNCQGNSKSTKHCSTNFTNCNCSCNGFIDKNGGGECLKKNGNYGYWCYVEDGSCSDAVLWYGHYYSYEACKKTHIIGNQSAVVHMA